MKKVLFVCLGNICRSPMAEAIFSQKINDLGLEKEWQCDSCGTAAYHVNEPPDARTMKVLAENGISYRHLGRQFSVADFHEFDFIFVMDKQNLANVRALARHDADKQKVRLFREYDSFQKGGEVPDPYYGDFKDFEHVFEMLDRCTDVFLAKEAR